MNIFYKSIKHFNIISKHKWEVFKECCRAGIPLQGILHDLSKYTPSEFIEYAKYYNGKRSPVDQAKEEKGYCNAWLHHKGHNPHHYEYWIDYLDDGGKPLIMPYKYAVEMVCDYIGAGKVYGSKTFNKNSPLEYWNNKKKTAKIHPSMMKFFDEIFADYSEFGESAIKKYNLTFHYEKNIGWIYDINA